MNRVAAAGRLQDHGGGRRQDLCLLYQAARRLHDRNGGRHQLLRGQRGVLQTHGLPQNESLHGGASAPLRNSQIPIYKETS